MGTTTFKFRIEEDDLESFKSACESEGLEASKVLRSLINEYSARTVGLFDSEIRSLINQRNKKKTHEITIGEMYSGPGGLGIAACLAKHESGKAASIFKHVFAIDSDADACQTYRNNVGRFEPNLEVFHADIRKFDVTSLKKADGFLYGFPCNDFSLVGETKGLEGEYGPLYKYGVDYINFANPKFILAENVSGISSANSGRAFKQILQDLEGAGKYGYELTAHLYKFEEYGVPQARHRYIIIGFRKDLGLKYEVPEPSGMIVTSKEALEIPPIPANASGQELTKQSKAVIERLKHIKPGQNAWTAELPKNLKLNVKGAKMSMIYRRLDPKRPSYTITGSGGGGTHVYHYKEPRALTNRERARLQTFPDWYDFFGSKESVRKQLGMAVPVEGAKILLDCILKTMHGERYSSVPASIDLRKLF